MHRGGLGAIYEIEALAPGGADVFLLGERGRYAPFGVNGGGPAALNRFFWQTSTGEDSPPLASKVTDVKIQRGQRIRLETPGGGGWGDPLGKRPDAGRPRPALGLSYARGCARTVPCDRRRQRRSGLGRHNEPARGTSALSATAKNAATVVGVDVGGTFTDVFWFDESERRFGIAKSPSHRGDEAVGFIEGLKRLGPIEDMGSIVHGTTVGTNALLERKGARIGVITTRGFRDVLEMRRRDRPRTWGLWGDFTPVADRDMRLEVDERVLADGALRTPVDLAEVKDAARALLEKGAEALAIIFINAYANPANERAAAAAARRVWPNRHVSASSEILPEIREFERASTTALNAYLQPVVGSYLEKLSGALARDGFGGQFHIVQSNGGVMSTATALKLPVRTALSGPAAGVIAAAAIAHAAGYKDVITADLGGTSFDVSLIAEGASTLAAQTTIDFGLVIRTPDDRDHHDRRRRRFDRPCRPRRLIARRAGKRRIAAGPRLLRPRRRAPDADRRQCCARPHQRRAPDRRRPGAS